MRHKENVWDDEGAVQMVRTLWAEGLSAGDIAKRLRSIGLSVTRCSVLGKVHRLGLPLRGGAAQSHRTYRKQVRPRAKAAPTVPRAPRIVAEDRPARSRAPAKTASSVRFINRSPNQCAMFCEGEEGASGFVCGAEIERGQWCSSCARLVYQPFSAREAA